jgi:hypothetical protein
MESGSISSPSASPGCETQSCKDTPVVQISEISENETNVQSPLKVTSQRMPTAAWGLQAVVVWSKWSKPPHPENQHLHRCTHSRCSQGEVCVSGSSRFE